MSRKKLDFDAQLRPSSKKYIPKAAMRSTKCKWKQGGANSEVFFTASASITQFIPGANDQMPAGFVDLQMGHYNRMKINTRDFLELAEAIKHLAFWFDQIAPAMQKTMDQQLSNYMEHQYKKLAQLKELGIAMPNFPAGNDPARNQDEAAEK